MRDFRAKEVFSAISNLVSLKFPAIRCSLSARHFEHSGHLMGIYMNMEKLRVVPVADLVEASIAGVSPHMRYHLQAGGKRAPLPTNFAGWGHLKFCVKFPPKRPPRWPVG